MFDKETFSEVLTKIYKTYNNQRDFADATGVNRAYLSQYMNKKLDNPPTPKILEKIANNSNGITTYTELMHICGYLTQELKNNLVNELTALELNKNELDTAITAFIENYIICTDNSSVNIYDKEDSIIYYAYELITRFYFDLVHIELPIVTNYINPQSVKQDFFEQAEERAWNKMKTILESINEDKIITDLTAEERAKKYLQKLNSNSQYYMTPVYRTHLSWHTKLGRRMYRRKNTY